MPSERFMQQHYGASGFVGKTSKQDGEVSEDARLAAVVFCDERNLDYTLGTMLEMARFAEHYRQAGRLQGLEEAAKAVCSYCDFPEKWSAAEKGQYPDWWHHSIDNPNIRNSCTAWAVHHKLAAAIREKKEQ